MRATSRLGGGLRADSVRRGRATGLARAVRPRPPIPGPGRPRRADFVPRTNGGAAGRGRAGAAPTGRLRAAYEWGSCRAGRVRRVPGGWGCVRRSTLHIREPGQVRRPRRRPVSTPAAIRARFAGGTTREPRRWPAHPRGVRHATTGVRRDAWRPRHRMARSESLSRSVATRRIERLAVLPSTPRLRTIGPGDSPDPVGLRSPGARRAGRSPPRAMSDGGMHTGAVSAVDG